MAKKGKRDPRSTSVARLTATQGLYEIEITGASLDTILLDFLARRWQNPDPDEPELGELAEPDKKKFDEIVRGVIENKSQIDDILSGALSEGRSLDKLDVLLRSVLRAAAYEMFYLPKVPVRVIINEYVDLAHAFYAENEPSLVNGVLDRLAKVVRSQELEK
ncbi:MAG: transcription antitermination factor NusB [Rhodospirillaceae bacterium]|jgi:transcription antitermination protein NusB|nr:transcription antitermination factor NusB [Rhodospirillaceae bacterium]MBT7953727.1 transcription antitermination factor NusB [Rhodospirillaceae bacterium]